MRIPGLATLLLAALAAAQYHDVRRYGARGDGKTKDTAAIQAAIAAAAREGGTVLFPPGTYLCGTIHLKSGVALELAAGAVIAASPDKEDFAPYEPLPFKPVDDHETTYSRHALILGEGVADVAIAGAGVIDGNRAKRGGPKPIAFKNSQRITIRGVTVRNSPNYAISLLGCEHVHIEGVSILNSYADGIDPDCSRFVRIANCYVDSHDDAICPKASQALGEPRPTEHLVVTNCILRTDCNAIKFGTESRGDFRNVTISNCVILPRDRGIRPISGISLHSVDGSHIEGVTIANIVMRQVRAPLFIRLGNRGRGMSPPVPGSVRGIVISNLVAVDASYTSGVVGIPGHRVRDVTLENLDFTMAGGGSFGGLAVPEHESKYPEATMFGQLPAWALYARHVEGLVVRNLRARFLQPTDRPAIILDDVLEADLDGFRPETVATESPVLWFHDVLHAFVRGARVRSPTGVFLRVSGPRSDGIALSASDLRAAGRAAETAADAPPNAVRVGDVVLK
ncbi:MAG: glycosyl hydrolase family 28-related protein [Bryobacterales bacterium]|nr:glycosyl hydrolase family 28 protein [Bryobacteraceae bacterium]MDW8129220.1 glycosyl hydrolase family 28-related protein [Bryobacterales bacterium]